jgi:hypothetical protein
LSPYPVDQLIRELIRARRAATPVESQEVIDRMVTAPFDARLMRVPTKYRGLTYQGRMLGRAEAARLSISLRAPYG